MVDKNKGESVRDANPHDLKDHFEFAHAIARSWEDVPRNVKKAVMDQVLMSHLIRTRRAMTSTPRLTVTPSLTTIPTTTAIAPAEMDHRSVNPVDPVGPPVLQAAQCTYRHPRTTDHISPSRSTTDASGTRLVKKNTQGPCRQLKTAKVTRVTNGCIPIRYDERHQAAPTAEQHSAVAHDIGHVVWTFCPMRWKSWKAMLEETKNTVRNQLSVALEEGCLKELEDRQDSWVWLCGHFLESGYVKKAKTNKINREKKTFLHYMGSRPFSYRMEARRKKGSKFPEIDVFAEVYVQPGMKSASQLPSNMPIESVDPPEDAGFHIVMALTEEVAGLRSELALYKSQMLMLIQALSSSRLHFPASTTIKLVDLRPVPNQHQDPSNNIPIDFSAFFFFYSFVPAFF
ncbi:hypothetical protein D8674_028489 [Pyrus ussuriensis x Pyrus communis]|uniref:Uncharacterized protein n=1 Tax=Pyrus ussuriensis x Pyrus communis TaxID=2448454 RepID=A0A5N5I1G8_9ROSA|nr:hypothetical protein D8674_028489 [Pyrus ussuriensis x Pyrus communis]